MAVYKDKNGTWYVSARYDNWQGEHARKVKRGFKTKKDAMEWERDFLLEKAGSLDMTFEAFVALYKTNLRLLKRPSACGIMNPRILPVCAAYALSAWIPTSLPAKILSVAWIHFSEIKISVIAVKEWAGIIS